MLRFVAVVSAFCWMYGFAYPQKNQTLQDPSTIREGASLFRGNCSPCHGLDAKGGGRGPDLTLGRWVHGGSDEAIFQTVLHGVPGTQMPANSFEDSEAWALVAYLRSISSTPQGPLKGDRTRGEGLYGRNGCVRCHMIRGSGGHLGPDLSRVGAERSFAYLTESIREPSKQLSVGYSDPNNHYAIPLEYDTVTVLTRDHHKITGVARDEDEFTIQLLGEDDELHLFSKEDLIEVRHNRESLMPAYGPNVLSDRDLEDILAYLSNPQ
jgi:cytochrome c oxidase cbb3-type subunit 3